MEYFEDYERNKEQQTINLSKKDDRAEATLVLGGQQAARLNQYSQPKGKEFFELSLAGTMQPCNVYRARTAL